jgi:hypothetical protein
MFFDGIKAPLQIPTSVSVELKTSYGSTTASVGIAWEVFAIEFEKVEWIFLSAGKFARGTRHHS